MQSIHQYLKFQPISDTLEQTYPSAFIQIAEDLRGDTKGKKRGRRHG